MSTLALRAAGLTESRAGVSDRTVVRTGVLRLEIIQDAASFLELKPHWDALLEKSAVRTPFMRWDWMNIWREEFADEIELAVGVVRDSAGVPRAIAPLALGRGAEGMRRHFRMLTFMGCIGSVTTEGVDFLIAAGEEAVFAPVLAQIFPTLSDCWDSVLLPMMHEESASLPFIREALQACAVGTEFINRMPSRFISLPPTWAEVEHSHGNNWRSNHRRKWKKMIEQHAGRPLLPDRSEPADASLSALLALHARRWSPEESLFLRPEVMRFHERLARSWMPAGRLIVPMIELDGAPAAASYCMVDFDRLWFYQAGWNESYSALSIGKLSTAWIVQCAQSLGLKELDFLPGDSGYKREWSNQVRYVLDVEAFNPVSLRASAFRAMRAMKRKLQPERAPSETCGEGGAS